MDDGDLAELRALRWRAYGPDADIDGDPAALARLRELERPRGDVAVLELRSDVQADPDAEAPPDARAPETVPTPLDASVVATVPSPAAASASVPAPGRSMARRRRIALLCSASIGVGVLVTAWIAASFGHPSAAVAGAHYSATIRTDDTATPAPFLTGDGSRTDILTYPDYFGFTPFVFDQPSATQRCLMLASTKDLPGTSSWFGGLIWQTCASAPFPIELSFTVGEGSADAMRSTFGDGAILQFVVDGDAVDVFQGDARAVPSPTP